MESTKTTSKKQNYFYSDKFSPCKLSKYFWMFSATILLVGVILLCTIGFNLGIDFTGGNMVEISTEQSISTTTVETSVNKALNEINTEYGTNVTIAKLQQVENNTVQIQYQNAAGKSTEEMVSLNEAIVSAIKTQLGEDYIIKPAESVSASASGTLLLNSFLALAIAIVAILIYVAIRFELLSGLSAIITLFHDVLMMCALVLIFRIEVNAAFIAAVITILGYSVNNTIVVFDRVRENLKKETLAGKSNKEIADISVKQTLTRTFNTSLTTILAVVLLAIIGVTAIRQFIIPILFGLIVGTYAAIFISAPLWAKIITNSRFDRNKKNAFAKKDQKALATENVVETTAEPIN